MTAKELLEGLINDPELSSGIVYPYPHEWIPGTYSIHGPQCDLEIVVKNALIPELKAHRDVSFSLSNSGQFSGYTFYISDDVGERWKERLLQEALDL